MVFLLSEEQTQIPGCILGECLLWILPDNAQHLPTLSSSPFLPYPKYRHVIHPSHQRGWSYSHFRLRGHNDPKAFIRLKTIPCPGRAGGAWSLQNGDSPHCTQYWLTSSFAICLCGIFSARIYGKLMKDIFSCKPYFLIFLVLARINAQRGKQGQIESTRRC